MQVNFEIENAQNEKRKQLPFVPSILAEQIYANLGA